MLEVLFMKAVCMLQVSAFFGQVFVIYEPLVSFASKRRNVKIFTGTVTDLVVLYCVGTKYC